MCATKMSYMRVQEISDAAGEKGQEEEEEGTGCEKLPGVESSGCDKRSRPLLSRHSDSDTRTLSVPNLLNLGSKEQEHEQEPAGRREGGGLVRRDSSTAGPVAGTADELGLRDVHGRNYLANPSGSISEAVPQRARQGSIDYLMRAAVTVEKSDEDYSKQYQNKMSSIIELRNQLSDEIKSWPSVKSPANEETLYSPIGPNYPRENALLSEISPENVNSLRQVASTLNATVQELDDLKYHQSIQGSSSRQKVTLPPINTLASNIARPQVGFQNYQFPNSGGSASQMVGPPIGQQFIASSPSAYQQQPHSNPLYHHYIHPQGGYAPYAWPASSAPPAVHHKMTVSDPLHYHGSLFPEVQGSQNTGVPNYTSTSAAASSSSGIVFQPLYSPSNPSMPDKNVGKNRFRSKSLKTPVRTQRSTSENLIFENSKSLAHGLIMAENIRRNEQSTTSCVHCGEASTPEWRRGPYGNRTLCNACGLFYRKLVKRFGSKDANMFMRYRKQVNPEDRRVPSFLDVPSALREDLDNDKHLDDQYFTIGGANSNIVFTDKRR